VSGPTAVLTFGPVALVERASATPALPGIRLDAERSTVAPELAALQRWFLDVVTDERELDTALRSARRRHGFGREQVEGWLGVYHDAYRLRLVECLADDFPGVAHAMGHDGFERLALRAIAWRPSTGPNLNAYGNLIPALLAEPIRVRDRAFLRELAELEWAIVEAVHAAPPETVDGEALRAIPPERWGDLRFTPNPALRILRHRYPANAWYQAFREDRAGPIPRPRTSRVAVYRVGASIWRMELTEMTAGLLDRLCAGQPLGDALAPLEGVAGSEQVMAWFSSWVSGGFFSGISA
jgi:hypothetical protein